MKSNIIKKSEKLYESGDIPEALQYYSSCLWNGEEENLELAVAWLSDKTLIPKAGEQFVCFFIGALLLVIDRYEEPIRARMWELCKNALNNIPPCEDRDDTSDRYVVECNLYRHMNEPKKALEVILEGLSKKETVSRCTFAGLTYLDLEMEEDAEHFIALGYAKDPHNASAYNDLGDYYFEKNDYQKAADCYYNVLESGNQQDCDWAEPSWIFCCYMEEGNSYELERLVAYAAANIDNKRAQEVYQKAALEQIIPNVDYIEHSTEAIINLVCQIREADAKACVKCTVSCQESASSTYATRMAFAQMNQKPISSFEIIADKPQNPPLDETIDSEGIVLWKYMDIDHPIAALPVPSENIQNIVGELASTHYLLKSWYEAGKTYAKRISKEQVNELYGTMVHPPSQKEDNYYPEEWLSRVQFAAVCILANISLHEIDRICKGQLDWPIIPAFTLAAWLAAQDVSYAEWAENLLNIIQSRISQENYCFFEHAYACAAYLIPNKDDSYYAKMWKLRRELERC